MSLLALAGNALSQLRLDDLPSLLPGRTAAQNALWIENEPRLRFVAAKRVVVAQIEGPATITMIHFAMPGTLKLNRDVLLRIYWDGEKAPSVDCPLVDFFCDAAGRRDDLNTALVNKRRGWNAYFPMPFRRSARVELVYDGPLPPGEKLYEQMPCYSYVMYRTLQDRSHGQRLLPRPLASRDVAAGQARLRGPGSAGPGQVHRLECDRGQPGVDGYPVDQNEKFFIDGEAEPSVELQGMEDSFGFSWGFPESQSIFPLTGYYGFFAAAPARIASFCKTRSVSRNRSAWRSASANTRIRVFGGFSVGPAAACNSPARCIGTKSSRTPRCRRCLRPPSGAGPGRPFLA